MQTHLTATAVIASVLSGKPESSLTLLALSNGAEMLTEYAAEKARSQISSLLNWISVMFGSLKTDGNARFL